MKARIIIASLVALLVLSTALAQTDLNNQAITRQNPINSPLPPPPAAPLPVPGAAVPNSAGNGVSRPSARNPAVIQVRRVVRRAHWVHRLRVKRPSYQRQPARRRGSPSHERNRPFADRIPSICRGC